LIDYEITRIDQPSLTIQIKYSKEGFPDYYVRCHVGSPFNEEAILAQVKSPNNTLQVTKFWDSIPNEDVTLSSTTGTIKETVVEDKPLYDEATEILEKVVAEEETEMRESWSVRPLTEGELAAYIRQKRNALLFQTDQYALSDRTMSPEMTAYRDALRNITDQESFPFDIVWPIKPLD
jgi:hypothetical protein